MSSASAATAVILAGLCFIYTALGAFAAEPTAKLNPAPNQPVSATGGSIENTFRQALFEEEANQDLAAAIPAYRQVIIGLDAHRKLAATAVFRLGECYRKQGQTNEAVLQFERVRRDFSEQTNLLELAQRRLLELAPAKALASAGEAKKTLNPAQAQLVRDELKLLEKQLEAVEQKIRLAAAPTSDRIRLQQEILSLQRQLPENTEPAKQQSLINQQIKLAESLLADVKQRVSVGAASSLDTVPFEREILALKRDLAAISQTASEGAATDEEAKEVQRIKAVIKDSPDLINTLDGEGSTPLHHAAAKGQLLVARFLLDNHADPNAQGNAGRTPLLVATEQGHKTMVELLLANGAKINTVDNQGQNPLFVAALNGYKAVVETLLAHRADVKTTNAQVLHLVKRAGISSLVAYRPYVGLSALHAAVDRQYLTVAERLIGSGADVNAQCRAVIPDDWLRSQKSVEVDDGCPLHFAAAYGDEAMAKLMLAHGAKVNVLNSLGNSPLLLAARNNRWEIAQPLLDHGADINTRNQAGYTALRFAVQNDQFAPAKMLLEHRADPNLAATDGVRPLHDAVSHGNKAVVELLLDRKADPNVKDRNGQTPLTMAAGSPTKADLLELLLAHGADVNAQSDSGRQSPLHFAGWADATNNVKVILAHKPDLEVRDQQSFTPLQRAVAGHHLAITELLLNAGADPNAAYDQTDGSTPLHWAVRDGQKEIAKLLLGHKANINAQNKAGLTPLRMIVQQNPSLQRVPLGVPSALPPSAVFPAGVPPPRGIIRPVSPPPGTAITAQPTPVSPGEMADLLRQYGASENPDRPSQIALSRPALNEFEPVFYRGTNDPNRYTLLELLTCRDHPFPDFANMTIHRLTPKGETNDIKVNAERILDSGDPAQDVWLSWGDIVELPVKDHLVDEKWAGYPAPTVEKLTSSLQRAVEFVVKGQTNRAVILPRRLWPNPLKRANALLDSVLYQALLPGAERLDLKTLRWIGVNADLTESMFSVVERATKEATEGGVQWLSDSQMMSRLRVFWRDPSTKEPVLEVVTVVKDLRLDEALRAANVLLTSSDLTRVKVRRIDPITKERLEMVFNLEKTDPKTDLWLRNGDVIEIPERATSGDLSAENMTPAEAKQLQQFLATLRAGDKSSINRIAGRVIVVGQVKNPGIVEIPAGEALTVSVAILKSGGFTDSASPRKVRLDRKPAAGSSTNKVFVINVDDIWKTGKRGNDMPVEPDDLIFVPAKSFNF